MSMAKFAWRDVCTVRRETLGTRDPITLLPVKGFTDILVNERCDLSSTTRRVVNPTENGVVVNSVRQITLRLEIRDPSLIPDENDEIVVNGELFKIDSIVERNFDPISGVLQGIVLGLSTAEVIA